jgi:4-hydroxybenzoate polyprenyltransferase
LPDQQKTFSRAAHEIVRGMRVHQWLKNLLIFVPAATSHRLLNPPVFSQVSLAFFSFSLCASAGYLINDLLDRKADRQHPAKRGRPFASGAVSPSAGMAAAALLFLIGLGTGSLVSPRYVLFLCGYLALAIAYSAVLKTVMLLDIFLLASFYTLRVFIGGEAAGVTVSFWLAAFSTFFFFSLAMVKRFNELRILANHAADTAARHDYASQDLGMIGMWGTASGCASIVVLALYINSDEVTQLYRHPSYLWPICLAVLFWLNRIWMLANRTGLPYDPIVFAARDRQSYIIGAFVALAFFLAL